MSSYLVLARKYRPQNFAELIGQEVLVKTLTNAMRNNRLHHGYILTGIRGVGKTTTARIIAKTLNCLDVNAIANAMACGNCDNCKLISSSHHQDVIEIDAASRTGIEGIREIIDSIAYAPVMAKYKIYIIDEVHMLSNQAFNALLKTLEEPPVNVKFIFATTEIRKVPVTILSRCQRFDLRRLDELEIVNHLKNILAKENFEAEDHALALIAKASEGSVRDSLSLLDQALAINNHQHLLTTDLVEKMLGLTDSNKIIDLLNEIFSGNTQNVFKFFYEIYSLTSDLSQLLLDMLEMLHKIIASKAVAEYKIYSISPAQYSKINQLASQLSLASLMKIWHLLIKAKTEIDLASNQKNSFEILLIKLCFAVSIPDLQKILLDLKPDNLNKNDVNLSSKSAEISKKLSQQDLSAELNLNQENDSEIIAEILRNFPQAKLVN
jgi:DNA polymerase-3 subunit gamma/tau